MKSIILEPLAHKIAGEYCERQCKITRTEQDGSANETLLWFQFDKNITPPQDEDCDSYLLATIMDAMKEKRHIEVKGSVSKELLSNLVEYQAAWSKWLPETYQSINITCQQVREQQAKVDGAICAFSGGVDATFSVWMHSQKRNSYRSQDIKLCSLVHGFDIPIEDETAFSNARNTIHETLSNIDLTLFPIKTNFRKISRVNWEHSHACALVSTLSNFKNSAGTCIIGSSEPYDALVIPWGSSPITDHLLSSGDFSVVHDGASYNRTEKVKGITDWQAGLSNLRVCWQGDLKDRNCGKCEKCVRTKLNFLAVNAPIPSCFPQSDIIQDLQKVKLKNKVSLSEWQGILTYAQHHGINEPWVIQVANIIHKKTNKDARRVAIRDLIKAFFK
ncbi:hypothetical protein ACVBKF_03420 [Shewanella sp. 0m-11]